MRNKNVVSKIDVNMNIQSIAILISLKNDI